VPPDTWSFSDAWVMTAVAISSEHGCDLSELIGAADACNHAILTDEELARGIGRLVASGLLSHDEDRFQLSDAGRDLASRRKGGLIGQLTSMQKLLARHPMTEGRWNVAPEVVSAAVRTYLRRAQVR
jgi:hypothetical protein